MRKYRGLTKEGKWVKGGLYELGDRAFILKEYDIRQPLFYGFNYPQENFSICLIEVIPETVGQFTGEKDLWEGDIVKISRMNTDGSMSIVGIGQIVFDQARFYVKFPNGKCSNNLFDNIEKVGNRFQKPELLEKSNEVSI